MVAPLSIARGTQNKLLEAMSMGVPVVTSHIAAAGVDAIAGEHLHVASTPKEYCDAICRLLDDPAEHARLSRAGRERMLSHHNWESSMSKLDKIIERCISRREHPLPSHLEHRKASL
jgi:glycosyltransferase involved in cell wall biosynthesis